MSRIGKLPITVPDSVEVTIEDREVKVKGPNGELSEKIPYGMRVEREDNQIIVRRESESKLHRSLHGLTRTLIANMVTGTSTGFAKTLEIQGVGYRAVQKGDGIEVQVGYSQPVQVSKQPGITFEVPAPNRIVVRGANKQQVGEIAAEIRALRPPEPYKGKGIRYQGEHVRRKAGKTAK